MLITLQQAPLGDLISGMQARLPNAEITDSGEAGLLIKAATEDATVMTLAFPYGDDQLSEVAKRAPFWPEATDALAGIRAHSFVLVTSTASGHDGEIAAAELAVRIVSELCAKEMTIAAYAPDAGTIMSADRFAALGGAIDQGIWPIEAVLGLGLHKGEAEDGSEGVGAITTNATPYLGVELHTQADNTMSPVEHCRVVMVIGSYLLSNRVLLEGGEILGEAEGPQFEARAIPPLFAGAPTRMELVRI